MWRRIRTGLLVVVLVSGLLVGVAYAWDASGSNKIADGVVIAGIDVGGLGDREAAALLQRELADPLEKPVTVTHDGVKYKLKPENLNMEVDVDGMVASAIAASREDSLPTRVWRDISGGKVNQHIGAQAAYGDDELEKFEAKLEAEINREAKDAEVQISGAGIEVVGGEPGRYLKLDELRERLAAALMRPDHRKVKAPVTETQPGLTKEDLVGDYPTYVTVDRTNFKLRLWKDLELEKTYPIAVGAIGMETPAGEYNFQNKAVNPAWSVPDREWAGKLAGKVIPGGDPRNALKARWIGIYDGAGIHGTSDVGSLGTAASHGCVRMDVPDVIELYDLVEVGDPVYIE